jgi:hypothetical protein
MARQSIPSSPMLWQRHETLYVGLFYAALQKLSEKKFGTSNEDMISERLCPIFHTLCYEESRRQQCEIHPPCWEKPIQPVNKNELKGGKKRKRPDFTCTLYDYSASCADEFAISFHVECKRLGVPSSSRWILNENYVTEGIKRFDCSSHEYGKRAASGMMIGYIISMSHEKIQDEVNTHQTLHCPDNPRIAFLFDNKSVQRCHQDLKRKNVKPDEFKLIHLWVDLRS